METESENRERRDGTFSSSTACSLFPSSRPRAFEKEVEGSEVG